MTVLNCFKNDRSGKFIGVVIFKKYVVQVEKIKVKVYVNQGKSLSHIKIRHAYDFSLCFPHALLMNFEEQIKDSLPGSANGADKQQWQSKINLIQLPKGTPTIAIQYLI